MATRKPLAPLNAQNKRNMDLDLNTTGKLVDPEWETLDPTPDIHSMFNRFNDRFFKSELSCVELEWSKKMYSCAGICYSRRNRMGHSVTIRLSEPLLKLRTRKNLVETLLHEMIHAFMFIRGIREGNGGHGPFFHQMMHDINKVAGTNITVYHTFHDEVNVYKTHVWRCNGICMHRKPFFGYIRRTSNRAPGPNDFWWKAHQESCGGYFAKVAEPEKVAKEKQPRQSKKKETPVDKNQPRINDLFNNSSTSGSQRPPAPPHTVPRPSEPPRQRPTAANIRGFSDLNSQPENSPAPRSTPVVPLYQGAGHTLSSSTTEKDPSAGELRQFRSIQDQVRNHWLKRFESASTDSVDSIESAPSPMGKQRVDNPAFLHQWQVLDDDIAIKTPYVEVIDLVDSESDTEDAQLILYNEMLTDLSKKTASERSNLIRQELYEDNDAEQDEIEIIDDEFDDTLVPSGSGGAVPGKPKETPCPFSAHDVVKCPVCEGGVSRHYLDQHMEEGCLKRSPR